MKIIIHDTVWIEDKPAPDGRLRLKNLKERIVLTKGQLLDIITITRNSDTTFDELFKSKIKKP